VRNRLMLIGIFLLVTIPGPQASDLCDSCSTFQTIANAAADVDLAVIQFDDAVLDLNNPTYRVVLSLTNNLETRAEVIESTAARASLQLDAPFETIRRLNAQIVSVDSKIQELLNQIQNQRAREEALRDVDQQSAAVDAALTKAVESVQNLEAAISCLLGC